MASPRVIVNVGRHLIGSYDMSEDENATWEALWTERLSALERLYGKSAEVVGHAVVPFDFGPDDGGAADIVYFDQWTLGRLSITAELLGRDDQVPSELGAYELAVCHRDDESWGPAIISKLAHYTLEVPLNPGETMDIGSVTPEGSTTAALLFQELGRFEFRGQQAGVLLCIGITEEELSLCQDGKAEIVVEALKKAGVYPYTDLYRKPVVIHPEA